ncbi:RagB/SusD family nutrient uptake outer membrane protein [Sphingobacterium bambusae]|uniref:RagB/SusD family nutrient uptake outer membrane protein n=1 Tax=Sphingobacterium bambusae TaxID=662858 RepID=A0ABW6BLZ6_9SPHI|nr:RagB/SusD family nutrient uptake outer membrane protein [Sphingobacterium bambusae]WPL49466.1 RagB/SusD family nutrient uptake outer membrane protein [Sphingobacterium bambusae]
MKIINRLLMVILCAVSMNSCDRYTDLTPKGKNLLLNVDDLDYLLNVNLSASTAFYMQNLPALTNDMYLTTVSNILANNQTMNYAILTYDETLNRADLQKTDLVYEQLYALISSRLNVLLDQVDNAEGDVLKGKRLKAEALTLRAFLHYLVVNIYAKAYDPATAAREGGIAYMDKLDFENLPQKSTVEEVYQKILTDLRLAEELDALHDLPQVVTRPSKAFLYAVKAEVFRTMRRYEDAIVAADKALTYNNNLEDHRPFIATGIAVRTNRTASDNILLAADKLNNPTFRVVSIEVMEKYFEKGYILKDYTSTYSYTTGGVNYSELNGTQFAFAGALMFYANGYQQNAAGMTVSDLYFIKAESLIRLGRYVDAMTLLNYVKERRFHPSDYVPYVATDEQQAMAVFKKLSRLEFLFTWKNYVNIKRWNTEDRYKETITRTINGKVYSLSPQSPLWIFPFPQSVTNYNTNMTQNY